MNLAIGTAQFGLDYGISNFSGKVKNEMALMLDSDVIYVQKWHYVKKENKNNPDFMKIANENDRLAIRMEDDPYQWWIS